MASRLVAVVALTAVSLCAGMDLQMGGQRNPSPPELGDTIQLLCTWKDVDEDNLVVNWLFNGKRLDTSQSARHRVTSNDNAQKSVLEIQGLRREDQGNYTCLVQEEQTIHWTPFILDLKLAPEISVHPTRPYENRETNITCTMIGRPHSNITWWYQTEYDEKVNPETYIQMYGRTRETRVSNSTGSYLIVTIYPSTQQEGYYKCASESRNRSWVELDVVAGVSLDCDPEVAVVTLGDDLTYSCDVRNWQPKYFSKVTKWQRWQEAGGDGQSIPILPNDHKFKILKDGALGLIVNDVNDRDLSFTFQVTLTVVIAPQFPPIEVTANMTMREGADCMCEASYLECNADDVCDCQVGYGRNMDKVCQWGLPSRDDKRGGHRPGRDPFEEAVRPEDELSDSMESHESDEHDGKKDDNKVVVLSHGAVAVIVGATVGTLALLICIIIVFFCYRKRRKAKKNSSRFDPNYLYQYEYHGEANTHNSNPAFINHGYQLPPLKLDARKENTYVSTIEKERIEFPRDKLQLGVDLGEGRFGKVIQGRANNITGTGNWVQVAVKTCRATATDFEKQDLYQELEIMRKIPAHPNVVTLYGCCSKTDPLYIIMEYVQRGNMLSYLRKCRPMSRISRDSGMPDSTLDSGTTMSSSGSTIDSRISMISRESTINSTRTSSFMQPRAKDLTIFALQIARGMAHIANCGIIHRDLAARNILLGTDFTCKICDFGLARDVEGVDVYERTSKGPLPIRWMSPESLHENLYTKKSDVWSYGILLWEIVTLGATPYAGKAANEVMRQVLQGSGSYLPQPLHCRQEMYDLMMKCWEKPELRPSFAEIVSHFEMLMDDDYIILDDYDESTYTWLDSYTMEERV